MRPDTCPQPCQRPLSLMMGGRWQAIWLLLLLISFGRIPAHAQYMQPKKLKIGASLGAGGMHWYCKPSFDLHYAGTSLRFAPGLFYYSFGITQRIGYYRKRVRMDRPLILSAYYSDDWLLMGVKRDLERNTDRIDQKHFMLMLGLHVDLDHMGRVFFEGSIGGMAALERFAPINGVAVPSAWYFYPMVEVRFGGIVQFHKEIHQDLLEQDKGWLKIIVKKKNKKKKKLTGGSIINDPPGTPSAPGSETK